VFVTGRVVEEGLEGIGGGKEEGRVGRLAGGKLGTDGE
jgi:hypothetical protein